MVQYEERRMIPQDERRVTISEDIWIALMKYSDVERKRMKNPLIGQMITPKSMVQHILRNEVQKRGYYKPGKKVD